MNPTVSIILPIHNQADHVVTVIEEYHATLRSLSVTWEIILVENGSRDDSAALCAELAIRYPNVRTLRADNAGWGRAVRTGLAAARGEFLCYTNSARTAGADLRRALDAGISRPDRVLKAERKQGRAWLRALGSQLYNLEARLLFGLRLRDINGTPKLFHRRFEALLDLQRDDDLIDLEFCIICRRHGYAITPFGMASGPRHGGRSTTGWRTAMRLYRGALRMRLQS
ncbi:MAG: glycosyltransferase [Mesorhizobium sp.]|uniref:glycosyltransferase family 2 protein n=1 Tax=unclassified Mesorhizobium TaxID=325217 RepID=UPI000F75DB43|nr:MULTISPECIES: glycosyltransferase family 2 protein [unclassified Mesorhizobium]AZO47081.1 glycosyltransferase family 2 protein [Mesorhizobium sp. M4B.F.Ca.ET.058.02.1.1]RVC44672.1 glycosyltransferase [Mesorhizobium sp. M4A.F.Ca.ET.090.04.2.1]RVC78882.1 glycosyltransferase [Mesorhizobium sp. M4A.F.Ca.ET.022.05.2.1]RWC57734.1 MAG: glycosyltransferase [Mesorhizobium sp.]RWD06742.1 MAG: glycosyltransferase [Mesorhizobium sp.]